MASSSIAVPPHLRGADVGGRAGRVCRTRGGAGPHAGHGNRQPSIAMAAPTMPAVLRRWAGSTGVRLVSKGIH